LSKFHAVPVDINGRSKALCTELGIEFKKEFDSRSEHQRYVELKEMEDKGDISDLTVHSPTYTLHAFPCLHSVKEPPNDFNAYETKDLYLHITGSPKVIGTYTPDFTYINSDGDYVVEDRKGGATTEQFRWKTKHLLIEYGVKVTVTRSDKK